MGGKGRGWTLRLAGLLTPVTIWLGLFFLVPLLLILAYSFGTSGIYGGITLGFNPGNYLKVFDPLYLEIIVRTFVIAALTTLLVLRCSGTRWRTSSSSRGAGGATPSSCWSWSRSGRAS